MSASPPDGVGPPASGVPRLSRWAVTALTAAVLVAGAAGSLAPWWQGARTPETSAEALIAAGRATGLLGGYLLMVEVALVARTPCMETRVGADRVLAWHRWLGETVVLTLVAHAVLLVLGYAWARDTGIIAQSLQVVLVFPGALTGRHRLRVLEVVDEGPSAVSVHVGGRWLTELVVDPGQSFRWRFLARGLWWQAHPFSLSAAPTAQRLRITVRATGDHAARLAALAPGTRVVAEGPSGALGEVLRGARPLLLVGGGVGVTPLRALLDAPPSGGIPAVLLQRATRVEDLLFIGELADLAAAGRVRHVPLVGPTDDPSTPVLDAATLRALVPDLADRTVVVCGPEAMTRAVRAGLRDAGVARRHVHSERFRLG